MPAPIIIWRNTQPQKVQDLNLENHSQSYVSDKIKTAAIKGNTPDLIEWLAYAKVFHLFVGEGRKYFAQIERDWPSIQREYPHLGNKFNFLNSIFSEHCMTRSDSAQMCNRSALIAEFSHKA